MQQLLHALLMGCFGWFLVWLLIKAITHPIKPIKWMGLTWKSGINSLLQKGTIRQFVNLKQQNELFEHLQPMIDEKLNVFLKTRLAEKLPMISMFIGDQTIQQLKTVFMDELRLLFPDLMHQLIDQVEADFIKNIQLRLNAVIANALSTATKKLGLIAFIVGFSWSLLSSLIIKHYLG